MAQAPGLFTRPCFRFSGLTSSPVGSGLGLLWLLIQKLTVFQGCDLRRYENNPHGWRFIEVSPLPNLRRDGQDHIGTAFPRLLLEPVFARQGDEA